MASKQIKTVNFLPEFLRTNKNSKFLSSTIDQLIQPPSLERLDNFVGSKLTPNYNATTDQYVSETFNVRKNYQLLPSLVIKDEKNIISDVVSFDDLLNELSIQGGVVNNIDRLIDVQHYSYNPLIDWDKLINYQEYYWLTTGPETIVITGQPLNTTSTFTVTDNTLATSFVFSPDGLTEDPVITLYRGNTYNFVVQSENNFYIKTDPEPGPDDLYNEKITNNGTSNGTITMVVDSLTPDTLYYVSNDAGVQGQFVIKNIQDDTFINVESEIIGKKEYQSGTGIKLSNGMKIRFGGTVQPEIYQNKEYFVEGVGSAIKLIEYNLLSSSEGMADSFNDNFDVEQFDDFPFDNFKTLPLEPEYITINRASKDLNPWTRYNRWVHSSVIKTSAEANNLLPVYPLDKKAKRPIIEFIPDIQLYNFGSIGIKNVDLIDNTTTDAFSLIEGTPGYYVDGVLLQQGHRVIFNVDTDPAVRQKIYKVNYVVIDGKTQLQLLEDELPTIKSVVSINYGNTNAGLNWWFNGDSWVYAQQHTKLNECPLFDLFDTETLSYSEDYSSDFKGNKIFGYAEGTILDTVLGFGIKQEKSKGIGSYLFKNYFMTDSIGLMKNNQVFDTISTAKTFVKVNNGYKNVWESAVKHKTPVLQFQTISQSTSTVVVDAVDNISIEDTSVVVLVNNKKLENNFYTVTSTAGIYKINFINLLPKNTNLLIKIYSNNPANEKGYYEPPLTLTNNPNNGIIDELTLSELGNHLDTIVNDNTEFFGTYPGNSNLRDLKDISKYGSQIITSVNPMIFASMFIGKKENNLLDAITKAAEHYNQFKFSLIKKLSEISDQDDAAAILDQALKQINIDKDLNSPYFYSDMLGYGTDKTIRTWTVSNVNNTVYSLTNTFTLKDLSLKSVLVYFNGVQLLVNKDYVFTNDDSVQLLVELSLNDKIEIVEYYSTEGCFIPPTPTKLGLYPKYQPKIYFDDTYVDGPIKVIQGHDGSITVAYNDYRDDIILEFEKRVYNNIKADYRNELIDLNSVIPGAFRDSEYSADEINSILQKDFIRWAGFYGIDYEKNSTFDPSNPFTFNFSGAFNTNLNKPINGTWRSVYKYFYDTDRPHTHPWEMLGFSEQPSWWESEYGPAPYTSGNELLWEDIAAGRIKQGTRIGIDPLYIRSNLLEMLPVDEDGNLVDPLVSIASDITAYNRRQNWIFGDQGPAETAWRRSSYWPFAVQKLLALTKPATYASLMYDPIRVQKNIAGQWVYGDTNTFLSLKNILVHSYQGNLTSGYSVYVAEVGRQRSSTYIEDLTNELKFFDINLFYKVGGFVSKDKLQVIVDAIDPDTTSPGSILPPEDYELILNTSNPIKTIGISGIIIQKYNGKFVIKGYDRGNSYFTTYTPLRNNNTPAITVGGISEPYIKWSNTVTGGNTGLSESETTTANQSITSRYYQQGQIVQYQNNYYRVTVSHRGENTFNSAYFQRLPSLPIKGGATVQIELGFDKTEIKVPYGTEFLTVQEVYDFIIGYGAWLEDQGFMFDQFNKDLNEVINWKFSGKEFLYWTTQNWAENSVITLSPFADQIKYQYKESIVDNIFNNFYEYSILQANGTPFPQPNLLVDRNEGICTIKTLNQSQGIYFAQLNSIQKEHAMVFKNTTIFNDTIYDLETGSRQLRVKLIGFRTKDWNGDYFSPGFVYDEATITDWKKFVSYNYGDVVRYSNKYYSAIKNIIGSDTFNFEDWAFLSEKPTAYLLPNFDYKINQFEDFYSLDIDNFDSAQQQMAQHLTGYTPRVYLNNIFTNPIAQYKFYQGFIKEKGTRNAVTKLAKASLHNLQGELTFTEEWAFRIGHYGSYETYKEVELPLTEGTFVDNPQVIQFVEFNPNLQNNLINYIQPSDLLIKPSGYKSTATFITLDQTFEENNFQFLTAGYVRLDDVTATAFNEDSILDISNNEQIQEGDTLWIGFKDADSWDIVRYTKVEATVQQIIGDSLQLLFITDNYHGLAVGDIISVIQTASDVNGIYKIVSVPDLDKFVVAVTTDVQVDPQIDQNGLIFKFESVRYNHIDNIPADDVLLKLPYGTKLWVDKDASDKWAVYEKYKNYESNFVNYNNTPTNQQLGYSLYKKKNNDVLLVGAPTFAESGKYGKVFLYKETTSGLNLKVEYTFNEDKNYQTPGSKNEFGYSVFYDADSYADSKYGLLFAGAPGAGYLKSSGSTGTVRYSTGTEVASTLTQEGALKISSINPILITEDAKFVLLSPYPKNYERFGSSVVVESGTSTKLMMVGAPETRTTGTGAVYVYNVITTSTLTVEVISHPTGIKLNSVVALTTGSQWGQIISSSDDLSVIAISAPGYNLGTGVVQLFDRTTHIQTLTSPFEKKERFGEKVVVSNDGETIFVSAPLVKNDDQSFGKVVVYTKVNNVFTVTQIISNPVKGIGMKFGQAIDINYDNDLLVVTAVGTNNSVQTTFDKYKFASGIVFVNDPDKDLNDSATTFDSNSTFFNDTIEKTGTAYLYDKKATRFILADELTPKTASFGDNFGYSVNIDNNVYVGSPAIDNNNLISGLRAYSKIDENVSGIKIARSQDKLVDTSLFQKVTLIQSFKDEIIDYLDVIDPLKGKIAGLAEQELKYKSNFDPAVYTIGNDQNVVDQNINWVENHIGELWWDLSTVKYIWYEQGDLTYRKTAWGQLFPGSTIDIYEWVSSEYLPSEWSTLADTAEGLALGISGQPKYPDNSVFSVKETVDTISGAVKSIYYYWVKNKVIVPDVQNRRTSAYQISQIIENPTAFGIRFIEVLSSDAIAIANISNLLVDTQINLNISFDEINNRIPKHTEWLLLEENSPTSVPNTLLEKKLIDSLLGHDKLGNPVPDPLLSSREKYGISIRPRQTMFKNRFDALRNLTEFVNDILIQYPITGNYSFKNLNKKEEIPLFALNEYDLRVPDIESLNSQVIDTQKISQGILKANILNGRIYYVVIEDAGYGYITPPTVTINDGTSIAELKTEIDSNGKIINVIIVNAGEGFKEAPTLKVRPFTVIVETDEDSQGKWAKYVYSKITSTWNRVATQKYNTKLYWNYVDWSSNNFNPFLDYKFTVDDVYQLNELVDLQPTQYVKVKNGGDGLFIILEKLDSTVIGNFSKSFNLVFKEKGTIQISESIWNLSQNQYGFDQQSRYDQTLYDQTPDIELENILKSLKEDIFINELKINWNLFFFKAVKYALSEQKLLDWAFKTSFINVKNYAGELDQKSIYKLQDSSFYEDYLKEVKPYHTTIRSFTTDYTKTDDSNTYVTDFDLPTNYNVETQQFEIIEPGNELLNSYPWKSWNDNYTYSIGEIIVGDGGSGYTSPPEVLIQAVNGDTGTGAQAKAYIRSGSVISVVIVNSGYGYKAPPTIILSGGGTNVVPARLYPRLTNNKVRSNTIGIKFDRITKNIPTINNTVVDTFFCNGSTKEFVLNWLAMPDKLKIVVTLDNVLILGSDYKIEYYNETQNGYTKKLNKIVFLNSAPQSGQILKVSYTKNIGLLNASERILSYYTATSGMPGLELDQLMTGIEYGNPQISGLMFDYTNKWDLNNQPFGLAIWEDDVSNYVKLNVANTATTGSYLINLTTSTGIAVGKYVNIISYLTNKFSTSTDVKIVSFTGTTITVNSSLTGKIIPGDEIELWSYNPNSSLINSDIDGGTWSLTTSNYFVGALGVNPEDLTINGENFFSVNTIHSPEELVPGHVLDSVGINVYTKTSNGSPMIFAGNIDITPGIYVRAKLGMVPPGKDYITVSFNNILYEYFYDIYFSKETQFTIDWETNEIILPPQSVGGKLGYTIIDIGGGRPGIDAGVIDSGITTAINTWTAQVQSLAGINSIKSAYVTVNGYPINKVNTTTQYGYMLTAANDNNQRAAVTVYNLDVGINTIQAWFFTNPYKYYNEIREQIINVTSTASIFTLTYPPGILEPAVANSIVEIDNGTTRRRLLPPYISYYEITNSVNTTFLIDNKVSRPSGTFNLANTFVYVNGLSLRPGFDYTISSANSTITLFPQVVKVGDVLAIVGLPAGGYDYNISGSTLVLDTPVSNVTLKVITFNNHDEMLIRTERFVGSPTKRYKISRPVLNDNYVWVQVNGIPLTNKLDFEILDDQVTVQISDKYTHTTDDNVVIMSISSARLSSTVLGYRIFNDMFDRTHFKRLSKNNTTYLIRPLTFTDTEIYVADAEALTPPIPSKKIPGIILVDGERIEFNKVEGNVLKQLRRSTLGTSPSFYSQEGTKVIDQGINQTIPFSENILRQTHLTSSTINTYVISTVTTTATGDGIVLSLDPSIQPIDQISVIYGGRQLRKFGTFYHDISVAFDSSEFTVKGSVATLAQLPTNPVKNDAYIVTATNQVWIYKDSLQYNSVYGYEYNGLNYVEPEFFVSASTSTGQLLTLNLKEDVRNNIKLVIVKKDFSRADIWNSEISPTTTLSLLDSTTIPAKFLQAQPAELPDKYYYGGSIELEDNGSPLLDENNDPLTEL